MTWERFQDFVVTQVPNVICVKEGSFTLFDDNAGKSIVSLLWMFKIEELGLDLEKWIESERWPSFPEVTYGNLHDIGLCCDKLLVLIALDIVEKANPDSSNAKYICCFSVSRAFNFTC